MGTGELIDVSVELIVNGGVVDDDSCVLVMEDLVLVVSVILVVLSVVVDVSDVPGEAVSVTLMVTIIELCAIAFDN